MSKAMGKTGGIAAVLFFCFLAACQNSKIEETGDGQPFIRQMEIKELVSHLPADVLPSGGPVSVRFIDEQAAQHQIGVRMAQNAFNFIPPVDGYQVWDDAYTITFYPEKKLERGKEYTCTLDISVLLPGVVTPKPVNFSFTVAGQELEQVTPVFSTPDGARPNQVELRLELRFFEPVDPDEAEESITLTVDRSKVKFGLEQGSEAKTLVLRSPLIERTSKYRMVRVLVEPPLAGTGSFERDFSIPPDKEFVVSTLNLVDSDDADRIGVDLLFSEPLDESRDYTGFITVSPDAVYEVEATDRILRLRGKFIRGTSYSLVVQPGVTSLSGAQTDASVRKQFTLKHIDPQVSFDQTGSVLPFNGKRSISFRTVNVDSLTLSVQRIYANNLGQFLQVNAVESYNDRVWRYNQLHRVAEVVHSQVVAVSGEQDQWTRTEVELGPLLEGARKAAFVVELSGWDERRRYYGRSKLIVGTDLGITAKWSEDKLNVFVSSISGAGPVSGARAVLYSQQLQELGSGVTGSDGMVTFDRDVKKGLYVAVEKGDDRSYMRTFRDSWQTSSFETGGVQVNSDGTNAFIYTDRGVYRPGDSIHLSCVVRNGREPLPVGHPVTLKLSDPRGQLVRTLVKNDGVNGLYTFGLATDASDMTGSWQAELEVGDRKFHKELKVETVIPNRLKVELAFNDTVSTGDFGIRLDSRWLFGAPASGLSGEAELWLRMSERKFKRYPGYVFNNPTISFEQSRDNIWSGKLDAFGNATIIANPTLPENLPSALEGFVKARVFEPGGNFTEDVRPVFVETYETCVGLKPPKTLWGRLKTGEEYRLPLVVLDSRGEPVSGRRLEVTIYYNSRYWWWDYGRNRSDRLRYRSDVNTRKVTETVMLSSGSPVELDFSPELAGRYYVEVTDPESGHSTGWMASVSSWGAGQSNMPQRADVLVINSERKTYQPGQTARIRVETPVRGTALVTLEKGGGIIWTRWLAADGPTLDLEIPVTSEMLPNAYVSVSLLQPLASRENDFPMRMYGIMPLMVEENDTRLPLELKVADELAPNREFEVELTIPGGREGWATVAVVDEGLLDLTDFTTPDPWKHFYAKQRLSVETSDIFDQVLDYVRGEIGQRYTIGGDFDAARRKRDAPDQGQRFKPVAMFSGPVHISPGGKATISFTMPNYIGSVRVMAVAVSGDSYASLEKAVPVKSPLIVLPTIPRVIGPAEEFDLPVTVFAMHPGVKSVEVTIKTDSLLSLVGKSTQTLTFQSEGDQVVRFRVRAAEVVAGASISLTARSGEFSAAEQVLLPIRPSNPFVSVTADTLLVGGEPLVLEIPKVGIPGTNDSRVTISTVPNFNLSKNLARLIRYPYGCLEQTTSAVFPQLYLRDLVAVDGYSRQDIDRNINAAVARLSKFMQPSGQFSFWPGRTYRWRYSWAHAYAGHFLLAARERGYHVPQYLLHNWTASTRNAVRQWPEHRWEYNTQAYSLFLLSMAGSGQIGMMNWLRENHYEKLSTVGRWLLASAYELEGQHELAAQLFSKLGTEIDSYREFGYTYGSDLRDKAMMLYLADMTGQDVAVARLVRELATRFKGTEHRYYYSTQELAFTLLALGRYLEKHGTPQTPVNVKLRIGSGGTDELDLSSGLAVTSLHGHEGERITLSAETKTPLYVELLGEGIPLDEAPEPGRNGLSLSLEWFDDDGRVVNPAQIEQGKSFWAHFTVSKSYNDQIDELALSAVFPSGWEINNQRLTDAGMPDWMKGFNLGKEEYADIRDDRINWFFDLPDRRRWDRSIREFDFLVRLTATYSGEFRLPPPSVEAMYNPEYFARLAAGKVIVNVRQ